VFKPTPKTGIDRGDTRLLAIQQACPAEGGQMLAIAGTGYGLIGLLVIILLVVLIIYFVRRA